MSDERDQPGEASVDVVTDSATTPKETAEEKTQRESDEKTLALMRKQFRTYVNARADYTKAAIDDQRFRAGTWKGRSTQWHEATYEARMSRGQPCLTINRIPTFIRQVTNQARAADLRILVKPISDKGDPKLAEVLQGYIRNIEIESMADRAYGMGREKQAEIGLGVVRLVTEWVDDDDKQVFTQRIRIRRVRNPLAVYFDPAANEFDKTDGQSWFEVTDIDTDIFEDEIGEAPPAEHDLEAFTSEADETGDWFPGGKVRVVDWFHRENDGERKRWAQLTSGKQIPYPTDAQKQALEELGEHVERERWRQKKKIVWRRCSATRIYETTDWPADSGPFIPMIGEEILIEGDVDWRGVVRDAKEPAKVYNAEASGLVEAVGMGQKTPVIGARGQFGAPDSPMRKAWETAHLEPKAFLEYEPMDVDGKPIGRPMHNDLQLPLEGIVAALRQGDNDLKVTAGWNDASLGVRGPSESGRAITARQRQDEIGNSHYLDNERSALASIGRQLILLIRAVMQTPHTIRIEGQDGRQRPVHVYSGKDNDPRRAEFNPPGQPFQPPKGVAPDDIFDLSDGQFHVEVTAGQDPGTRREESVEAITSLFKGMPPEYAAKFYDLYFQVLDFPIAEQFAKRAKAMLPPEMQDDDEAQQMPPQARMMVAHLKQQLEQAMHALQAMQDQMKTDAAKIEAKGQVDQFIASMKLDFERWKVEHNDDTKEIVAGIGAKLQHMSLLIEDRQHLRQLDHEAAQASADRTHEALSQQSAQGQQAQLEAGGQAHAVGMATMDQAHQAQMAATPPPLDPNAPPPPAAPAGEGQ